ncbi:MAG: hypothetical protein ACOVN5_10980 [Aquidulcibacter sp.]
MKGFKGTRKTTAAVTPEARKSIVSAAKLWQSLCKEGGIKIAWKKGEPLSSYDRALESEISKSLFDDDSKPLATQLEGGTVSAAKLLGSFFAALQPFSQMLHEIYRMLDAANASAQDRTIRVALKPEGLDQPLVATLEQFREWEEVFRAASIQIFVPDWTHDALWALRRAFADDPETWHSRPPDELWDDDYRKKPGFRSPPAFEPTDEEAFDTAAAVAYETIHWFLEACRALAPSHNAILAKFNAEGGYQRVADTKDAPDREFNRLYILASAERDNWPVGMVTQIREARIRVLGLPAPRRSTEAARILKIVTVLIAGLPKTEALADGFEKVLSDIFRLPVWKERSNIYSVWVATQIVGALEPRRIIFRPESGQLNFGFAGSRLATIQTAEGEFALWSELRTELRRSTSLYRKHAIQPDYRIVSPGDEKHPNSTQVVIECKQYKKPSTRNFTEAVSDYAASCPDAMVALVNYGPIRTDLTAHVDPAVVGRVHFIENFRPASAIARLKSIIDQAVPGIARMKSRWSSPGSICLSWDAPLQDLDLHARVTLEDDVRAISFRNRMDSSTDVTLSEDIRSGPGQETLDINSWRCSKYDIYVHNYSGAPLLARSTARVEVQIGDQSWEFFSPVGESGAWWHVCVVAPLEGTVASVGRRLTEIA